MVTMSKKDHGYLVVEVSQPLVGSGGTRFGVAIRDVIRVNVQGFPILVNLKDAGWADSFGMGALLSVVFESNRRWGVPRVLLINPNARLSRLFDLARIGRYLTQFPDEKTAVEWLERQNRQRTYLSQELAERFALYAKRTGCFVEGHPPCFLSVHTGSQVCQSAGMPCGLEEAETGLHAVTQAA